MWMWRSAAGRPSPGAMRFTLTRAGPSKRSRRSQGRAAGTHWRPNRRAHGGGRNNEGNPRVVPVKTLRDWLLQAAEAHAVQARPVWKPSRQAPWTAQFRHRGRDAATERSPCGRVTGHANVSKMDAIIQVTLNKALKGDSKALAAFIQFARWAGLMDEEPDTVLHGIHQCRG